MKTLLQQQTASRLAEVTEARFKIKEALARTDLADVEWWEKQLKLRLNCYREAVQREAWAKIRCTPEANL